MGRFLLQSTSAVFSVHQNLRVRRLSPPCIQVEATAHERINKIGNKILCRVIFSIFVSPVFAEARTTRPQSEREALMMRCLSKGVVSQRIQHRIRSVETIRPRSR